MSGNRWRNLAHPNMEASSDESDQQEARIAAGVDYRSLATSWAQNVLTAATMVKSHDKPHVLAVLVEVAMMELPVKALSIAINETPDDYAIVVKGIKGYINIDDWWLKFRSPNRSHAMEHCTGVFDLHPDDGPAVYMIRVKKVKFQPAASASPAGTTRRTPVAAPRSLTGNPTVLPLVLDTSTTPAAGRRTARKNVL